MIHNDDEDPVVMRACVYAAITLLLALSVAPLVHANDDQDAAEASQRFRRGVALYREGAFRSALIEFERAYAIKPHYRLLYNMGETYLELSDYLAASDTLRRYLEEGGADIPQDRRDEVEQKLASLSERVALISVSVNREGAEIFIDDKSVGISPLARGVAVNLGRHRVSVRGADGATASEVVDVAGGDIREVSFALAEERKVAEPATEPDPAPIVVAPPQQGPRSIYHKIALGSAAATGVLAAGTIVGIVLQRRKFDSYEDAVDAPGANANVVASRNASAWRAAVVTDVLGGLTLAAAASGVTFWLLDRSSSKPHRPEIRLEAAGSHLLMRGEF